MTLNLPAIAPIDDASEFGPAMAKLSPQQRAWVVAFLATGHKQNASAAARSAGYGAKSATEEQREQTCKISGHRLKHDPKVQLAIKELAQTQFKVTAHLATTELVKLLESPDEKVRLKAIDMVLARTGLSAAQEINVNHKHDLGDMDDKAMIRRIAQLAQDQGMDPVKLLGSRGVVIDAEFEVVQDKEPAMSSAGLEDLL